MEEGGNEAGAETLDGIRTPFSKEAYMEAVRSIQRYIGQGDVFQVNLSVRQSRQLGATPEELYEWLRLVNPSPYMGFLRCPDFQLVSGSPELLVELAAASWRPGQLREREARPDGRGGSAARRGAAVE